MPQLYGLLRHPSVSDSGSPYLHPLAQSTMAKSAGAVFTEIGSYVHVAPPQPAEPTRNLRHLVTVAPLLPTTPCDPGPSPPAPGFAASGVAASANFAKIRPRGASPTAERGRIVLAPNQNVQRPDERHAPAVLHAAGRSDEQRRSILSSRGKLRSQREATCCCDISRRTRAVS